ncbi:hypothetical protein [Palleniella muris]|nr:hypothetical protein [Palleniella muris]
MNNKTLFLSMLLANAINGCADEIVNYAEINEAYSTAVKDMEEA